MIEKPYTAKLFQSIILLKVGSKTWVQRRVSIKVMLSMHNISVGELRVTRDQRSYLVRNGKAAKGRVLN